jgi:hypothetical protein
VIYARGLWGSYSQRNRDLLVPGIDFNSPSGLPYIEAGVGLENIFKLIRIDGMWRVTYTGNKAVPNFAIKIGFNIVI